MMILRAQAVVTMSGPPFHDGAVRIDGDRIREVAPWNAIKPTADDEVINLGECVLLPGLINAHCHLDYTALRGAIPPPTSFTDWIRAINERRRAFADADWEKSIREGFVESARFGTTTIANFEAFPSVAKQLEVPAPMRTWWLAELLDVRGNVDVCAAIQDLRQTQNRTIAGGVGVAPHAPFTASPELYRRCRTCAGNSDLLFATHLAESRDEMQMFRHGNGPLAALMREFGREVRPHERATPLQWLLRQDLLPPRALLVHMNEVTDDDFRALHDARALRFSVIHCPRSHAYFSHAPFPIAEFRRAGVNIAVGTDSLASNSDLNLFEEMRQLRRQHPSLSARDVLAMVTTHAAVALRQGEHLGCLRPGAFADLIAVPFGGSDDHIYEAIVAFSGEVPWRMVNGCS